MAEEPPTPGRPSAGSQSRQLTGFGGKQGPTPDEGIALGMIPGINQKTLRNDSPPEITSHPSSVYEEGILEEYPPAFRVASRIRNLEFEFPRREAD
ncbi:hypothetical protein KM043_001282 [Ampulex compressa]|nr:hypothetical protein KM043_001282 [Ampulex compressa]